MKRCFSNVGGVRIVDVRTVLLTGPCTHDPWLSVFKQSRSAALVEIETDAGVVGLGRDVRRLLLPRVGAARRGLPAPRPARRRRGGSGRLRPAGGRRPDAYLLPVLGPRRARRRRAGRHRGRALGPRRQGARPPGPPAARPTTSPTSLPAYATGGPSPVADRRPAPQGRVLPRAGVPGGQAELRLPRLRHPRRGAHYTASRPPSRPRSARPPCSATPSAPTSGLLLDGHMGHREGPQRWDVETRGRRAARPRAPYGLTFFEEPLRYDDVAGYAELTRDTDDPRRRRRAALDGRRVRRLRRTGTPSPSPSRTPRGSASTGSSRWQRLFGDSGRQVAPHAWSGGVGRHAERPRRLRLPEHVSSSRSPRPPGRCTPSSGATRCGCEDGRVLRPDVPGLGVELTEETRAAYPFRPGAEEFSSVPGKVMRS